MLTGVIVGFIFLKTDNVSVVSDWIKPWGTIFIRLLKLIAIPLVFVSLVKGISAMKDLKKLSKLGLKTVSLYLATTFFAVSLGMGVVSLVKPGKVFNKTQSEFYKQKFSADAPQTINVEERKPMDYIVEMVPENLFAAAGDNRNML